ncbi:diptericin A [Drosophila innubila]|uniref:diptericin A n=1 Tax=Drosophila innubila TaxID=198719 RepID=UPI00148C84B2|nr:diptericin A [Drosophila innubila]
MKVCFSLMFLGLAACVLSYPNPWLKVDELSSYYEPEIQLLPEDLDWAPSQEELHRVRRQWKVQGGGGSGQGLDLSVNGRVPVWQSNNGRHSLDATGQYAQHFGGPFGTTRPNWGAGATYTFRF